MANYAGIGQITIFGFERKTIPNTTVVIALEGPDPGLKAAPFGPVFRGLKPPAPSGNRDLQL
jgi:hypothetical protein